MPLAPWEYTVPPTCILLPVPTTPCRPTPLCVPSLARRGSRGRRLPRPVPRLTRRVPPQTQPTVDEDPATGAVVTTFDLRLTAPNREPVMDTAAVHAIEHLGATFLRNDPEWSSRVVYFGPMGCRTGFYLVVFGQCTSCEVLPLVRRCFEFVRDFEGEIPGARPEACGNWHDADLNLAHWWARRYLANTLEVIDDVHLAYPALLDGENNEESHNA